MSDTILDCGHAPTPHGLFPKHTTGYGEGSDGKKYCYDCCAVRDREVMDRDGRATLYLSHNGIYRNTVSNWPGSLKYDAWGFRKGRHNIAGARYDVWFRDHKGREWHGVQYGDFTQILHCKRLKVTA